ncbi:MAG TPA: cupin [Clostridiales bacterium]|nr:cupin [Clostridiales bacterium]
MKILNDTYSGEGMKRVYENEKWTVGIKNWKPANDLSGIDMLERHHKTDELFILLAGQCTLISATPTGNGLAFNSVNMQPFEVYNIPKGLWHNTITQKDTRLALIEDSNTGMANSDFCQLTEAEIAAIQQLVKGV